MSISILFTQTKDNHFLCLCHITESIAVVHKTVVPGDAHELQNTHWNILQALIC